MILDMLGYYVPLAPLFVAVGRRLFVLGEQGAALWTIGALMYVTAGSVAAMALAYGVPPLLRGYAHASSSGRQRFVIALTALGEAAVRGVWQTFDPIVTGAWAIASELALGRLGRRFLGMVGVVLGSTAVLFAGLRAAGVHGRAGRSAADSRSRVAEAVESPWWFLATASQEPASEPIGWPRRGHAATRPARAPTPDSTGTTGDDSRARLHPSD